MHGKALPWLVRLGRPDTIRFVIDNGLFVDAQAHVLALVRLDAVAADQSLGLPPSLQMLVDHVQAIPVRRSPANPLMPQVGRVVPQLQATPELLSRYLLALFAREPHLVAPYGDLQVRTVCRTRLTSQIDLLARHMPQRLMDFLRASSYYDVRHVRHEPHYALDGQALTVCSARDLVPEQVYLLGRIGDNKQALSLIIDRLGDVRRVRVLCCPRR